MSDKTSPSEIRKLVAEEMAALSKAVEGRAAASLTEARTRTLFPALEPLGPAVEVTHEVKSTDLSQESGTIYLTVLRATRVATGTIRVTNAFPKPPHVFVRLVDKPTGVAGFTVSSGVGQQGQTGYAQLNVHVTSFAPLVPGTYVVEYVAQVPDDEAPNSAASVT